MSIKTQGPVKIDLAASPARRGHEDPLLVRWGLTLAAFGIVGVFIIIPLVHVFTEAFVGGVERYYNALFNDRDTFAAIKLTLIVAPGAVIANTVFGIAAAWTIARFRFPGRTLLVTLIDLPFSVSPVAAGLMFVLIFGAKGYLSWLPDNDFDVINNWPGLILATAFVTFPFVARELIPVMEAIGSDEELAALSLGASARQMFARITLPNIKWGLLYGVILCNARAMGEFGAVYVVSGRYRGKTLTIPLRVETLFQENQIPESFALASLLTFLALITLVVKAGLERKVQAVTASTPPPEGKEKA
ncbi:MAG: sulfate ABC transporter permease subunit CysW [Gemmataceae bacterium]|nr:sulfate ABC transporter permease subunit CysW [Gemmataceae bacterium]